MGVLGLHKAISGHLSVPGTALPSAGTALPSAPPCAVTISRSRACGQHPDVTLLSWGWSVGQEALDFGRPVSWLAGGGDPLVRSLLETSPGMGTS